MATLAVNNSSDNLLSIGKIGAPFGIEGWVRVQSYTQQPENILNYAPLFVGSKGAWKQLEIEKGRTHGKGIVVKFKNVADRNAADLLKGNTIAIAREILPDLEDDQYYWADLEGMHVKNEQDISLGFVDYLYEVPQNDVLVIKGDGKVRHIPFVISEIVKKVCLKSREIIIDWDY